MNIVYVQQIPVFSDISVERSGSGVELRTRLREPGFESYAAVLKPWATFCTLHCSISLSCINEYLVIDSGGYLYEQHSHIKATWYVHGFLLQNHVIRYKVYLL